MSQLDFPMKRFWVDAVCSCCVDRSWFSMPPGPGLCSLRSAQWSTASSSPRARSGWGNGNTFPPAVRVVVQTFPTYSLSNSDARLTVVDRMHAWLLRWVQLTVMANSFEYLACIYVSLTPRVLSNTPPDFATSCSGRFSRWIDTYRGRRFLPWQWDNCGSVCLLCVCRKVHHVRKQLVGLSTQFNSIEKDVSMVMERVIKVGKQEVTSPELLGVEGVGGMVWQKENRLNIGFY